jgi:FKBP-type peptidyl-prolyl cis-trans isomerase/protein-disulfide isomerase
MPFTISRRRQLASVLLLALAGACDADANTNTPAPEGEQRRAPVDIDMQALGPRYAIPVSEDDAWTGANEAAVTMVVFLDYRAPSSVGVTADLERLIDLHGDQLRVVIKPYTRALESEARYLSRAVLAAGRQGRGWLMHERVIKRPGGIKRSDAMQLADDIGVPDLIGFGRDVDQQDPLDRNVELAGRFGVNAGTFIFLNGAAYSKLDGFEAMRSAYEAEAAVAEQLLAAGVPARELYTTIIGGAAQQRAAVIAYEPPFDGEPIAEESLASGVGIEIFRHGEGERVVDDNIVSFVFSGYGSADGRQVMGSREGPARLVVSQEPMPDQIAQAFIDSVRGRQVGALLRVTIPAAQVMADAPEGRHGVGDLLLTIEIVDRVSRPPLAGIEAFAGKARKTETRAGGLEISDYAAGQDRAARQGDRVTVHYIGQFEDGTQFETSHHRAEGLTVSAGSADAVQGFTQALVGARVGMLRKVVIPPALGYGDTERGKIPANSTLVFYLQVMAVDDPDDAESADAQTETKG